MELRWLSCLQITQAEIDKLIGLWLNVSVGSDQRYSGSLNSIFISIIFVWKKSINCTVSALTGIYLICSLLLLLTRRRSFRGSLHAINTIFSANPNLFQWHYYNSIESIYLHNITTRQSRPFSNQLITQSIWKIFNVA